jgi:hypothetical protein
MSGMSGGRNHGGDIKMIRMAYCILQEKRAADQTNRLRRNMRAEVQRRLQTGVQWRELVQYSIPDDRFHSHLLFPYPEETSLRRECDEESNTPPKQTVGRKK